MSFELNKVTNENMNRLLTMNAICYSPFQYTYVACWCYAATSQHPWSAAQARWSPPSVEQAACSTAPPQLQNERPRHNGMLTDLEKQAMTK